MLDRLSGYLYRKSDAGAQASSKPTSIGAATHNVASYNMMAHAYNAPGPMMAMPMGMPPMPLPGDGSQLDPALVASFNMNYHMQMQQMQAQMQAMQAMLQAQGGQLPTSFVPPPAPSSSNGGPPSPSPSPATSNSLPSATHTHSTMPALQQYHMAPHQVPQPPPKPEVAPMQMRALCNNIYSLVKVGARGRRLPAGLAGPPGSPPALPEQHAPPAPATKLSLPQPAALHPPLPASHPGTPPPPAPAAGHQHAGGVHGPAEAGGPPAVQAHQARGAAGVRPAALRAQEQVDAGGGVRGAAGAAGGLLGCWAAGLLGCWAGCACCWAAKLLGCLRCLRWCGWCAGARMCTREQRP